MRLVASMIVAEVELDRYLVPCVAHLLDFCDEVALLFDGDGRWSHDLVGAWGDAGERVIGHVDTEEPVDFYAHEGRARQRLLEVTLQRDPTHVLAIDADEFVTDGQLVRDACQRSYGPWSLCMQEVWTTDPDGLGLRQDGGWDEHDVVAVWRVDRYRGPRILDRQLACGRIPVGARGADCVDAAILHFGWANEAERQARHDRYARHDGGRFHQSDHLDSILWTDDRVRLSRRDWPAALDPYRAAILERSGRP